LGNCLGKRIPGFVQRAMNHPEGHEWQKGGFYRHKKSRTF
jgi:hypothetical protein